MNVLIVGSGGREHALAWKLAQSRHVDRLFCAPGNPGIAAVATLLPVKASDTRGLLRCAQEQHIDLTVVGPEQPLAEGIVDLFVTQGLRAFGPTRNAAELEWSKAFAKAFMVRHHVPTAAYRTFEIARVDEAQAYLKHCPLPVVLKADGLAAGKGVIICTSRAAALGALHEIIDTRIFGAAGATLVVEEFMEGEEASVFVVTDGTDYVLLPPAQDHKRAGDGDTGKNTGGMGAHAPAPCVTPELLQVIEAQIIRPTLEGMAAEGRPYRGCLYLGLMLTGGGPKVVEFNCRFGDPETQVVLPLYEHDLAELLLAAASGPAVQQSIAALRASGGIPDRPARGDAVCVVLASRGYPDPYPTGIPIKGLDRVAGLADLVVFHAGTALHQGGLVTAGGRVLGVTAVCRSGGIAEAIRRAYTGVDLVSFDGMHYRHDIGRRALQRAESR